MFLNTIAPICLRTAVDVHCIMLLLRSFYLHCTLYLFLIKAVLCQEYDAEHNSESDHDDHEHYSDSHYGRPDYSKYYSVDASASLVQPPVNEHSSGFIPSEFGAFVGHSNFDFGGSSSNKKEVSKPKNKEITFITNTFNQPVPVRPIVGHDYFEESKENIENADTYESRPGPNYISHKVPAKQKYSVSNVDVVEKKKEDFEEYDVDSEKENIKDIDDLYYDKKKDGKYDQYNKKNNGDVTTEKYNYDDNDGKSSYKSGGTTNNAPDYYTKLTSTPTLTPYQKYSFQPVVEDYDFKPATSESKIAPFNPNYNKYIPVPAIKTDYAYPDATATVAIKIANSKANCKKLNKPSPQDAGKDQIMDCYSCQDPKTRHNYEQCSYSSEPTPKSYYFTNSKTYKPIEHSRSYRYKRYPGTDDPYEYVKSQSQSDYNPEKESNSEGEEYRFGPDHFKDDGDKTSSEQESEKDVNNGEHCVRQKKHGMTCMVCKNKKTGGKYEQCAYATEPQEQKYAYVKEKKYNSKDAPEEEETDQTEPKPVKNPKYKKYSARIKGEKPPRKPVEVEYVKPVDIKRQRMQKIYVPKRKNDKPIYPTEDETHQDDKDRALDNSDIVGSDGEDYYGGTEERENEELQDEANADEEEIEEEEETKPKKQSPYSLNEYHFKLFPEFSNEESKTKEKHVNKPRNPQKEINAEFEADQTKDVEEVLAEFAKKDRSKCKKAEKNGMTCYLCIDDNGIQNEECMYMSESKPKAIYSAYHEAKELKDKRDRKKLQPEESQNIAMKVITAPPAFGVDATGTKQIYSSTSIPIDNNSKFKLVRKYGRDKNISRPLSIPLGNAEEQLLEESRIKRNTKYTKTTKQSKKVNSSKENDDLLSAEDNPQTPIYEHEKLEGSDGAFSTETRPVYNKVYGATLPKYMLEKSISEKEFDDFVANS